MPLSADIKIIRALLLTKVITLYVSVPIQQRIVLPREIERKGKTYYYVTKNFRVSSKKWTKIRRYVGSKPPSKKQTIQAIAEIETDAIKKGIMKPVSKHKYLSDTEAEKLQDLKEIYNKWYGKLSADEIKK